MLEQLTPRVFHLPFVQGKNQPSLGYVRGDRFSLMIDAGNTPEHVRAYLEAVERAGFRKPDFAALTHSHWDHCFGMCALDLPTIACVQTRKSLEMVSKFQWTPDALAENVEKGIIPQLCVPMLRQNYPDLEQIRVVLPTVIFSHAMTLDLGNCTCVLRHVTSAHARDTVIVFIPEEKMLFLGDAIYKAPVGETWVERPEKLRALIAELEPLDFSVCQPAHQAAMSKDVLLSWLQLRLERSANPEIET